MSIKRKPKRKPRTPAVVVVQIRSLLATGMKPRDVAAKLGCDVQVVYNVRQNYKGRDRTQWTKEQQAVLQQKLWLVPAPKLSWAQRFKVLFTGVV